MYGLQNRAVQARSCFVFGLLKALRVCWTSTTCANGRSPPSAPWPGFKRLVGVCREVFPFSGNHYVKFYWGTEERVNAASFHVISCDFRRSWCQCTRPPRKLVRNTRMPSRRFDEFFMASSLSGSSTLLPSDRFMRRPWTPCNIRRSRLSEPLRASYVCLAFFFRWRSLRRWELTCDDANAGRVCQSSRRGS